MTRAVVALALLGSLALVDSVAAKGPFSIEVCGSSGCTSVRQELDGREPDALGSALLAASDGGRLKAPTVGMPAPAPYYSLEIEGWVSSTAFYYVPSVRVLRAAPYSFQMGRNFVRRMQAATVGLRPWPTPEPTRVLVDDRRAADPAAYTALLGPLPDVPVPIDAGRSVKIMLAARQASPWTDVSITYFPGAGTLYRDSQWVLMPERLRMVIERDAGLAPPAASDSGSRALLWIVAGGLTTLVLAAAAVLTVRSRRAQPVQGRSARTS